MYKCRLVFDEWKCIKNKSRRSTIISNPEFKGYVGLLSIKEVQEKQVWKYNGSDVVVCDAGYQWLTIMPGNAFYCITVMMDANCHMQVCYIDMIDSQGIDEDGVSYFYDIYLDLVVYPDGNVIVDDMDELEDALQRGEISKEQYARTLDTAKGLQEGLLDDPDKFSAFWQKRLGEVISFSA